MQYYGKVFPKALRPVDFTYGTQSSASRRFHRAVADMWNRWVLLLQTETLSVESSYWGVKYAAANDRNFAPVEPVQPDQISTAPGATGALDQLFHVLADDGDAVLIAAPQ